MNHEKFIRNFTHNIGLRHGGLSGGSLKMIYEKHKPDMLGALNFVINRGHHPATGSGLYTGAGLKTAGGIQTAAGFSTAAGFDSGGGMDPWNLNHHKDMYHHVLSLSPAHWELYREKAAQVLGARPSPMWNHLKDHGNKDYQSAPANYQHILRMPNTHAAARMIEAEASSKGSGFVNAMKHVHQLVRKHYPVLAGERLANLNPILEKQRLQAFLKPIAHSVSNIVGRMKPKDSFHKVKHAFHDTVSNMLPGLKQFTHSALDLGEKASNYLLPEEIKALPVDAFHKAKSYVAPPTHSPNKGNMQPIPSVQQYSNHPNVPPMDNSKSAAPSMNNINMPQGGSVHRYSGRPC